MDASERAELSLLRQELNELQKARAEKPKPWWKTPSVLISLSALALTLTTTIIAQVRTHASDLQSTRQELRGLLQRLAALPKEGIEANRKYADDPSARGAVGGFINQENSLLARQAAEVVRRLPHERVSAGERFAVAMALQGAYDLAAASEFLQQAVTTANDFNTEIAALRMDANLQFMQGRPESGRAQYQRAMAIFDKYTGFDPWTRTTTHVWTELNWAASEAGLPDGLPRAIEHVARAEGMLAGLPQSPGATALREQTMQARTMYERGSRPPDPTLASQLPLLAPKK